MKPGNELKAHAMEAFPFWAFECLILVYYLEHRYGRLEQTREIKKRSLNYTRYWKQKTISSSMKEKEPARAKKHEWGGIIIIAPSPTITLWGHS